MGADRVSPKDVRETRRPFLIGTSARSGAGSRKAIAQHRFALREQGLLSRPRQAGIDRRRRQAVASTSASTKGDASRSPGSGSTAIPSVSDADVVGAMETKPEGFLWWRNGEFDDDKYAAGPQRAHSAALRDAAASSTCRFSRTRSSSIASAGKALIDITVSEGPRYTDRRLRGERQPSVLERRDRQLLSVRQEPADDAHPESDWPDPAQLRQSRRTRSTPRSGKRRSTKLMEAYNNEGYIYAQVRPVVERRAEHGLRPTVNLRWEIDERSPAIVNRDRDRRQRLHARVVHPRADLLAPGRRVQPQLPDPQLPEHRQPELLRDADAGARDAPGERAGRHRHRLPREGEAHRQRQLRRVGGAGHGRRRLHRLRSAEPASAAASAARCSGSSAATSTTSTATYTDPSIGSRGSREASPRTTAAPASSSPTLGGAIRTGGQVQLGFPVPNSRYTRLFVSYGGEQVKYGSEGLAGHDRNAARTASARRSASPLDA